MLRLRLECDLCHRTSIDLMHLGDEGLFNLLEVQVEAEDQDWVFTEDEHMCPYCMENRI